MNRFKGLADKLVSAFSDYAPTRGVAFILALGMASWGLWVILPPVAFVGPTYSVMLQIATEEAWAALFAFGGITMGIGVLTKDIEWIRRGAFIGFLVWGLVAVLGTIAEPSSVGLVTRGIIALLHAWIYVQVKVHPQLITGEVKIQDLTEYVKQRPKDATN